MAYVPDREEAFRLLKEFTKSDSLIKHALAVEASMRHFARLRGENEGVWGVIGLVHDIDYELYPDAHCVKVKEILEERGWPSDYIRAVMSHGYGLCTDVEPLSALEKTLYAVDELTGLITAAALMRPSKSVLDMEARSVLKKWKDKRFAAGVDRSVIERGASMIPMELESLIQETILGMRDAAEAIGLKGSIPS